MNYTPKHLKPKRGRTKLPQTKLLLLIFIVVCLLGTIIYITYKHPVPERREVSEAPPTAALTSPSQDVPVTTETPEPSEEPRDPVTMDYAVALGTLYTYDGIVAWGVQLDRYSKLDDLTSEEQAIIDEGKEICRWLLTLTTYDVCPGETLPQMCAKIVTQEIGGLTDATSYSTANMEKAAVVWCILNRFDNNYSSELEPMKACGAIVSVAKANNQFAYESGGDIFEDTEEICIDVFVRWVLEKYGYESGRVLPLDYDFFSGDGYHNYFRTEYATSSKQWDWSLTDPYKIN